MAIPVPVPGEPILDTWGAAVATELNQLIPLTTTSDLTMENGDGLVDVPGLTFPVVSGRTYTGHVVGWSSVEHTNNQVQWAVNHPGGDVGCYFRAATSGPVTEQLLRREAVDDETAFDAAGTADSIRQCVMTFRYVCDTDGTFAIRALVDGGTALGDGYVHAGSGGLVIESEP